MKLKYAYFPAVIITLIGLFVFNPATALAADAAGLAKQKASVVSNMHTKAKRAIVTAAQDEVFQKYFTSTDAAERAELKKRIDKVSLNVQGNFLVAEMCIIDERGHEHSRIVGNAIAPDDDLSTEEASAPFFKQAMSLSPKEAAATSIYMSPDAQVWVVAYVSPLEAGGKKSAFVHYEHDLDKFRSLTNKGLPEGSYLLFVTPEGYVFSDSRHDIPLALKGEAEEPSAYFKKLDQTGLKGVDKIMSDIKAGKSGVADATDGDGSNVSVAYEATDSWSVVAVVKK